MKRVKSELISVIVPIFNAEKGIEKCLNSIENQTYSNLEILMIDDGSTDNSTEICKSFESRDSRFKLFYKSNAGVSDTRNFGLRIAKGDLIGFIDADDWIEPFFYEKLHKVLVEGNADVSAVYYTNEIGSIELEETLLLDSNQAYIRMFSDYKFGGFVWNKLFKRSIIENIKFNTEIRIYEDMLFLGEVILNSNVIALNKSKAYHYIFNNASATKNNFSKDDTSIIASEMIIYQARNVNEEAYLYAIKHYTLAAIWYLLFLSDYSRFKNEYTLLRRKVADCFKIKVIWIANFKEKIKITFFLSGRGMFIILRKMWGHQGKYNK